jgi:ATP-dependent RNA helicase DOB1
MPLIVFQVVPVSVHLLTALSTVRLYIPKDLRPKDARQTVLKSIQEVKRRFSDNLPLLDPVEDMNINDDRFRKTVRKIESLEDRLFKHPLHICDDLRTVYELCQRKSSLTAEIKTVKSEIKRTKSVLMLDQLKCRKRVLRRLGYATAADVIELKGRVACEISSGDCLVLGEMIFNGTFNDLPVEQCVALLSCFVFEEAVEMKSRMSEELAAPLRVMRDTARRIARVCIEAKMDISEEDYVQSFRTGLMDVVYAWAKGDTFAQLCKMTEVFEGLLIIMHPSLVII